MLSRKWQSSWVRYTNERNKDHLNLRIALIQVQMLASESQYVKARSCTIFILPEKSQTGEKTKKCVVFYGGAW